MPAPPRASGPDPRKSSNIFIQLNRYLALAVMLPATTFVGYAIGYLLDKWLGTSFLYLVFLLLGIAAGFVKLIQAVNRDSAAG